METLAPSPDFRYVGCEPLHGIRRLLSPFRSTAFGIVPWGVLLEDGHRILRWPAVTAIDVSHIYGRDQGTPLLRLSKVTVTTAHEQFAGRAAGEVLLDRLLAYRDEYAREAAQVIGVDFAGTQSLPLLEPAIEHLLRVVDETVHGGELLRQLSHDAGGYRSERVRTLGEAAIEELRRVLTNREIQPTERRPLAMLLALRLGIRDLAETLIPLVQSPHAIVAGVAKIAAQALGIASSRTGSLDEVAPFLAEEDVLALTKLRAAT